MFRSTMCALYISYMHRNNNGPNNKVLVTGSKDLVAGSKDFDNCKHQGDICRAYQALRKYLFGSQHDSEPSDNGANIKNWAVLVAGSKDYHNYRHQANVCHAYQVLRKGGIKDENIVVFMYDDIAFSPKNPRPGIIINKSDGEDVYHGVPKDYTKEAANANNFYNVLLGNENGVEGGSGKVLKTGPNDNVFIYYADHGLPKQIEMPTGINVYAEDFIEILEAMHKLKRYNKMVIYVEACFSGSMFEKLLKSNLNIYAVTATNSEQSSFSDYDDADYGTSLNDLFSISWLEHSESNDMSKVTLEDQYQIIKKRVSDELLDESEECEVCQFGAEDMKNDYLVSYIGTNPENTN